MGFAQKYNGDDSLLLFNSRKATKKCIRNLGLIMQLPKQYQTFITKQFDEEGVEFSGGEQQKIALARTYCKTQSLITILDEPTSALDPRAEYALYQEFNDLIGARTAFFISHRLASTKFCDKIAVIKDKRICEFGSHAELMQGKGY